MDNRILDFKKSEDKSTLRILYHDNFRVRGGSKACRWGIVIDEELSTCDIQIKNDLYIGDNVTNHHRGGTVVGYCDGINAGEHQLRVYVGNVPGYTGSDCYTGWNLSQWVLEVQEIPQ